VNRHGILLEVVQVLTDVNLVITKAYISSDAGWFMDGIGFWVNFKNLIEFRASRCFSSLSV
jgi:hypothetical protein